MREWIQERYEYFSTDNQGLHHVCHFFAAGWLTFITHWSFVVFFSIIKEIYDIGVEEQDETKEHDWEDHFWDLVSWMSGAIVWTGLSFIYSIIM
jgi:hypothetical protein